MKLVNVELKGGNRHAFTLIELLVVIAIIGILVTLLIPVIRNSLNRAKWIQDANNLRQQGIIATQYAADNGGNLPTFDWSNPHAYAAYIGNISGKSVYEHPSNFGHFLADGYLKGPEFEIFWSPTLDNMKLYWNEGKSEWQMDQRPGANPLLRADYLFNPLRFKRISGLPLTFLDGRIKDDRWRHSGYRILSVNIFHLDHFTRFTRETMPRANILMMDGSVGSFDCGEAYDELTRMVEDGGYSWRATSWGQFENIMLKMLEEEEKGND